MRQKMVIGNWKMNGQIQQVVQRINELKDNLMELKTKGQVVLLPPAIYLPLTNELLKDSNIQFGAQNVYPRDSGAYTGELSGPMLRDFNCAYVLVGHSERRQYFKEDEKFVAQKFHHVKEHGMIPILCVGETLVERENGQTEQIITNQLLAICKEDKNSFRGSIIAYEPVWAIGTGQTASPEQVQKVHQFIRELIIEMNNRDVADSLTLLYGGSVNESNALSLFSLPHVDGGLIGGASLHAQQFLEIVKCINSYY